MYGMKRVKAKSLQTYSKKRKYQMSTLSEKVLSTNTVNPYIKNMVHSTKSGVNIEAGILERYIQKSCGSTHLEKVIRADLLDPQAVNANYVSYGRQLLAMLCYRPLLNNLKIPEDVKRRATYLKKFINFGSVGTCGRGNGLNVVRNHVANYISKRDGVLAHRDDIFLCSGTTDGFRSFIKLLNYKKDDKLPAILVPNPHHPVYAALIQVYGMGMLSYNLDESKGWEVDINHLKETLICARKMYTPRAILIINPDVMTGAVMTLNTLKEIVKLAHDERLILIADETYQNSIHTAKKEFHSIRKVQKTLGKVYEDMEVASLLSLSDGWFGECGIRAGYIELANFSPRINEVYANCLRITRAPNMLGQMMLDCMVNPPLKNHESYAHYMKEKEDIRKVLQHKSEMVTHGINIIDGFSCKRVYGGICTFPKINLPTKAITKAKEMQKKADEYFAVELLKSTGISLIPGSSAGCTGEYHLGITILPNVEDIATMLKLVDKFYNSFCRLHRSLYII